MNGTLPKTVAHMFTLSPVGKILRAHCKKCRYYVNFVRLPITPLTHARLARHVDYHSTFDDFVDRNPDQITPVAYDGPES